VSYEEEFQALAAWYRQRLEEYLKAYDEERSSGRNKGCLDSELDAVRREDNQEFYRRVDALQAKYGMPLK